MSSFTWRALRISFGQARNNLEAMLFAQLCGSFELNSSKARVGMN